MANKAGDFIWYELMTPDPDASASFYQDVIGWTSRSAEQPGMDYRLLSANNVDVAGLMPLGPEMIENGARPGWYGYIAVDDVDASALSIDAAGGHIHIPPQDIPGVGRFSLVADPQGVPFYIMRGNSDEPSSAFVADETGVGHCAWNELMATDPAAAKDFYSRQFGWVKDGEMDMGPMGKYEFLRHGPVIGAVMRKPDEMPEPSWTYYFRVADIDLAAGRVPKRDGRVVQGPHEVPGGDFIINGIDPQGAPFALVGRRGATT